MAKLKPYKPTPEDISCFLNVIALLADGGEWVMPATGMVYKVEKSLKRFILQSPSWDYTPQTMLFHHHNDYILRELGWTIQPQVDWDAL